MPTFVAWVDYSSAERQRMRQAVALFNETDTRDELGIGTIRDAFADELFPGTSVIQTRLRYALFVPWLYQQLEADRKVHASNIESKARRAELDLIGPLMTNPDSTGVIGRRSGGALQRLPSSVYWLLLQKWGIFGPRWTLDEYHRRWSSLRLEREGQRRTDDRGVLPQPFPSWNSDTPALPDDFPATASFELRLDEAEFLRDRIADACRGSLLAHAVMHNARPHLAVPQPWQAFDALPPGLHQALALAHRFALLIRGAALVYNLALAQRQGGRDQLASELENDLHSWASEATPLAVAAAPLDDLWAFCASRARVTRRTTEFLNRWQSLLSTAPYAAAARSPEALQLVEHRERQLKGSRSRFANPRALDLWNGRSGTGLLTYRWGTARQFLGDLYRGLDRGGR